MFGIDDAVAAGLELVNKFVPDPQEKIKAELEMRRLMGTVWAAQIELNKTEVQSGHWLGKWRGALGWGLVASMLYQFVFFPMIVSILLAFNPAFPVERLPVLDWRQLGSVLLGMLGIG